MVRSLARIGRHEIPFDTISTILLQRLNFILMINCYLYNMHRLPGNPINTRLLTTGRGAECQHPHTHTYRKSILRLFRLLFFLFEINVMFERFHFWFQSCARLLIYLFIQLLVSPRVFRISFT